MTFADYMGDYNQSGSHTTSIEKINNSSIAINRQMDDTKYSVLLNWSSETELLQGDTIASPHRLYLNPGKIDEFSFTCEYSPELKEHPLFTAYDIFESSRQGWEEFWRSGAAIDLSNSTDKRWKELERRVVLSQYVMKLNEAGSYPPQESGLVNNGWYGRFHFEMIWWHGVHYALWNRWPLLKRACMYLKTSFLPQKSGHQVRATRVHDGQSAQEIRIATGLIPFMPC